jgi:alkanesulfonate monooxygenase SsuD/methylene tetrahydromethanopterin reductase-like flavin-dependent oxidoreductase (luciferase family)
MCRTLPDELTDRRESLRQRFAGSDRKRANMMRTTVVVRDANRLAEARHETVRENMGMPAIVGERTGTGRDRVFEVRGAIDGYRLTTL